MAQSPFNTISFKLGVAGVLVLLAGFFLVTQLLGQPETRPVVQTNGEQQVIYMNVNPVSYTPDTFTVEVGKPVRWVINGDNAAGCTSYLLARDFGVSKQILPGENIVEFTPTKRGTFGFSCSMNMARGTIQVV